jgi:hypothetical protein
MNSKALLAVAAFAALASAAARADDITVDTTPFQSTRSRADVQSELTQFRTSGVNPWSKQYNPLAGFTASRSRAQVQAEYLAERDRVAALTGEDSGSAYLSQTPATYAGATLAGTPVNGQ